MEMERINDDTIRVTISSDDLNERGVTFLDLLDNHKEIESFFYSVLEEVDTDHQFASNDAVTFQVLPNRNGLELYISKNPTDGMEEAIKSVSKDNAPSNGEMDEVSDFLKRKLAETDSNDKNNDDSSYTSDGNPADLNGYANGVGSTQKSVIELEDFESLPSIAELIKTNSGIESVLYRYHDIYYLELTFFTSENSPETIKNDLAIAYEYGNSTIVSSEVLREHGEVVMDGAALELAKRYFK
ncbi:adaptor protein MecA [Pediococcus pentosaceus]|jgi:adapter protein MecA 1/2|uniref:Adapter protein MecA n=2 Tax=Pediococcus pentosaceus TaxID=1255 RepID=A0A0R2H5N8_PEDPE|nr:adaptor protein MecA [Pediococcus pentosaceus]AHA05301.1 competence negative regulator MecA [Pediococcus pentosaceus SL4]ANI97717.1 adaptor protein MecA [Pediococcus pentosaceus]ARW19466.1 Adapter protein MecA [Pediococcus pentosaceus]ASC08228.1 Adapter protein MecA [Pediococcus pentosaceus]AVL01698.1 adaptor protein MecA [Pediococcus pentosaceus]